MELLEHEKRLIIWVAILVTATIIFLWLISGY